MTESRQPPSAGRQNATRAHMEPYGDLDAIDVQMIDSALQGIRLRGITLADLGYSQQVFEAPDDDRRQAA